MVSIDGTDISSATIDGTDVSEITVDGDVVWTATPSSQVSRPDDNNSTSSRTDKRGVQFTTSNSWSKIQGKISANVSSATEAVIEKHSDSTVMGSADISNISAGDVFTIDLGTSLSGGIKYDFLLWAESGYYTYGYNNVSFPYSSDDGNLTMEAGVYSDNGTTKTNSLYAYNIAELGNINGNI